MQAPRPTPAAVEWAEDLFTIGVTGTNGKTSTVHLIASALSDVIEARTLMGGFLARLAAERRTKDDLKRMRHALAKLESAEADPERIQELELGFFRSMLQATNNRIFVLVANSMFAIYGSRAHVFREAFADGEHTRTRLEKIAQAIEEKNGETAEKVAVEYLRANGRALVDAAVRAESLE